MRISGGQARGIVLTVPRGDRVRPATDGLRQAVFSSLAARVADAHVLDLFAGSGAYGLEAFSRGATSGFFVEKDFSAAACVEKNLAAVAKSLRRDAGAFRLARCDVLQWTPPVDAPPATLVFIDPPYDAIPALAPAIFSRLDRWLAEASDPVVMFELPGELTLTPTGWTCVKRLGQAPRQPTAAFFRRTPA
jgi:16S rRNA (guanine966-N2)-methyltransferase